MQNSFINSTPYNMSGGGGGVSRPSEKGEGMIIDKMNEMFGINWSSEVTFQSVKENKVLIRTKVTVRDEDGETSFQEGYGGSFIKDTDNPGDKLNEAYEQALQTACSKWNVDLVKKEEPDKKLPERKEAVVTPIRQKLQPSVKPLEDKYMEPLGTPVKDSLEDRVRGAISKIKEFDAPPRALKTPSMPIAPAKKEEKAPEVSKLPEVPKTLLGVKVPEKKIEAKKPSVPTTKYGQSGLSMPEGVGLPKSSMSAPPPKKMEMPQVDEKSDKEDTITGVQKASLQSILSISGFTFEQLVKEAFEANNKPTDNIPDIDEMNRNDVSLVIGYGNLYYRRGE